MQLLGSNVGYWWDELTLGCFGGYPGLYVAGCGSLALLGQDTALWWRSTRLGRFAHR